MSSRSCFVEPADHAEIQQADRAVRQHDEISRVRIAVVEAVVKDHLQVHLGAVAGDLAEVDVRHLPHGRVGQLRAVEPFHRQHAAGRQLGIQPRDADVRRAGEVAGELLQVAGLAGEVELAAHDAAELGHRRLRPVRLQLGQLLGQLREAGQDVEIDFHAAADAGVLHLHDDVVAASAAVRGGPGRSTPRPAASCRSRQTARRAACRAPFRSSRARLRRRRTARSVCSFCSSCGERHADLVGPRAEDLAQLDERRPELFERQPNARFAAQVGERFAVAVLEEALHERQVEPADPTGQAVLAEDREDLAPAIDVAIDVGDGGDFHNASRTLCVGAHRHRGAVAAARAPVDRVHHAGRSA